MPPAKTLWKVEYGVDDAVIDLHRLSEAEFSPSDITYAVVENGVAEVESVGRSLFSIPADVLEGLKEDVRAAEVAGVTAPMASFTISGWQYKGEQARWALDYEREHGHEPSLQDFFEWDNQRECCDAVGTHDAGESLDEMLDAKSEEATLDAGEGLEGRAEQTR